MYVVYYLETGHHMDPDFHAKEISAKVETEEEAIKLVEELNRQKRRGVGYEAV